MKNNYADEIPLLTKSESPLKNSRDRRKKQAARTDDAENVILEDYHEDFNPLKMYAQEIAKIDLITPQKEIELAKRIKKGDSAAREQMITANLRLVIKIAREYEGFGMPLLDLISEGNIGLMKAVVRFKPSKGAKLSSYAGWWIKQAMRRALPDQGRTIRLPVHVANRIFHMQRADRQLHEELGREPTDEELADELNTTPKKVREIHSARKRTTDIDSPVGEKDGATFAEIIADEKTLDPSEQFERKMELHHVQSLMKRLDKREILILHLRFGLNDSDRLTLDEVGLKLDITRERVRQIEWAALQKLRAWIHKRPARTRQKRKI